MHRRSSTRGDATEMARRQQSVGAPTAQACEAPHPRQTRSGRPGASQLLSAVVRRLCKACLLLVSYRTLAAIARLKRSHAPALALRAVSRTARSGCCTVCARPKLYESSHAAHPPAAVHTARQLATEARVAVVGGGLGRSLRARPLAARGVPCCVYDQGIRR